MLTIETMFILKAVKTNKVNVTVGYAIYCYAIYYIIAM